MYLHMNSKTFSWFPVFNLVFTITFLILFQAQKGSSFFQGLYQTCGNNFSCGSTMRDIRYPFRGITDPQYCGHPNFVLWCDNQQVTTIVIMNMMYRVLDIDQGRQTMRIVSQDVVQGSCPREPTTLDYSFFEFTDSCTNYTFLYGCSPSDDQPGSSVPLCGNNVYAFHGSLGPGNCNASVTVPVLEPRNGPVNVIRLIQDGFDVRWKIDSRVCNACVDSNGRCGYDYTTNRTACWCPDPPYVSYSTCGMDPGASPENIPSALGDTRPNGGSTTSSGNGSNKGLQIGLPIAGGLLALVGLGFAVFCFKRRRKQVVATKSVETVSKEIKPSSSAKFLLASSDTFTESVPSYPSSQSDFSKDSSYFGTRVFNYSELEEATNKFDASRELGDGGFGAVYYGELRDGRVVAVKRLYENNFKRVEQFMNEVEILTRLQHQNLVKLYGCTSKESRELLLVYEYISNGTVADHLHGKRAKSGLLSWPIRLNIAIETAGALAYLHKSDVVHRDVKTTNILLDKDFHVKVADFGLSRLFPTDVTHVSTVPQGTPGYVDPEYYQCYKLTEKSDVYSFGVVLVELISSLQAVDTNRHRNDINLSNMAVNKIQNRALHELVDPSLGFETNNSLRRMVTLVAELAFRCLQQDRDIRPSMGEVLQSLKRIQNEDLNAADVEIIDILVDGGDAEQLKGTVSPRSPDSNATDDYK